MSLPRQVMSEQFYLITRRTTQRELLMRPDDETNNAFIYCLAVAAQRCQVDVLLTVAESNHHHTVIFDRYGNYPAFIEHFHKLFARCQNRLRGRWENFWASEEPSVVCLLDRDAVMSKLAYAATNPVKDRLVERVHHWPGVNSYINLRSGRPLVATRPRHFFQQNGAMPERVTLTLTIPLELGEPEHFRAQLHEQVETIEREVMEDRRRTGARVLGRRGVLQQSWRSAPKSEAPHRNLRPRFASRDAELRIAAMVEYHAFLDAYRDAHQCWLRGLQGVFPAGTYKRRASVVVPIAGTDAPN
jgi:putative transposase